MTIHLIGICGTAMATLAAMLKRKGHDVQGSDQDVYPPMSDFLAAGGDPHAEPATAPTTSPATSTWSSSATRSRAGTRSSRRCSIGRSATARCRRRCASTFSVGARSIVIAGTHGKTTTTSLAGWLLTHGGLDPSMLVGGIARNFGEHGSSYRMGKGRDFVIEGDEYDSAFFDKTAKFLKYLPDIAVVNNVEFDHADIYADFDAVRLAFRRLVNLVPRRDSCCSAPTRRTPLALKPAAVSPCPDLRTGRAPTGRRTSRRLGGGSVVRVLHARLAVRRRSRCRSSARTTCGMRWRRSPSPRESSVPVAHRRRPSAVRGREAAARGRRRRRRGHGVRRLRASSDRGRRDARGPARVESDRRIWAVFEPRSASSCRRVFQDDFARAFGPR